MIEISDVVHLVSVGSPTFNEKLSNLNENSKMSRKPLNSGETSESQHLTTSNYIWYWSHWVKKRKKLDQKKFRLVEDARVHSDPNAEVRFDLNEEHLNPGWQLEQNLAVLTTDLTKS